jgi:hypothetical protein
MNVQEKFNILIESDDIIEQTEIIDEFMSETIRLMELPNVYSIKGKLLNSFDKIDIVKKYILELEKCCIYLKLLYKSKDILIPKVSFEKGKLVFPEAFSQKGSGLKEPRFLYGFFFGLSELLKMKYNLED